MDDQKAQEIRIAILRYLDEVASNARSENMMYDSLPQIERALRDKFEKAEVIKELSYISDKGWVKQRNQRIPTSTFNRLTGKNVKSSMLVIDYRILDSGRDYLQGNVQSPIAGLNKSNSEIKYISTQLIDEFKLKKDRFNYKKLVSLLEELNYNYARQNAYSCSLLIRTILDHIPPIFSFSDFALVVQNGGWGETDKKYMKLLLDFKNHGDDSAHRQIGKSVDLIEFSDIPFPNPINRLLQECLEKITNELILPLKQEASLRKVQASSIEISLQDNIASWANYAVDHFIWSSFRIPLTIDNYKPGVPDYVSVSLEASLGDEKWKGNNFIFEGNKKLNEGYRIEAHEIKSLSVFISNQPPGNISLSLPMPDFDQDTLKLIVKTKSGAEFSIPFSSSWIQKG